MNWSNILELLLRIWKRRQEPAEPEVPVEPGPEPPSTDLPEEPEEPVEPDPEPTPKPPAKVMVKEYGGYFGKTNGQRKTWYFDKNMKNYPAKFYLTVPGDLEKRLVINNGTRWAPNGQPWYVIKQSEVPGRTMGLIAPVSTPGRVAYIEYEAVKA